ncbi:response regulator transcription factor [Streptomyces sp. NPDC004546]|uniref:response regulator transcription factor n=1 Tax=Streptomyces sp. NPDC004546 TaxID=3154282 RepID=UPI0033AFCD09
MHAGRSTLAPPVARQLVDRLGARRSDVTPAEADRLTSLSPREREVLRLLARGLSNAGIAAELGTTEGTVKGHVSAVLDKLGAESRVQAARLAYRAGLDDGP